MRDFAGDWNRAIAKATFLCAECGATAAQVALLIEEQPICEKDGQASGLIIQAGFFGEWAQIVRAGALWPVGKALAEGNAAALYEIDPLWAPFFCPKCLRTYCREHWRFDLKFDEEWPDWYDETIGTCPQGHERVIDD